MIKPFSTSSLEATSNSSVSSQALSRAKSIEIRAPLRSLEHISEVLARISATLDRRQMGKLQEQGGGVVSKRTPPDKKQAPPLVNTSYPLRGGVA